jgi:hypothetical protein
LGELPTILLVLGLILGTVTVVGHGIWVVLSYIFTGGNPRSSRVGKPERVCGTCGRLLLAQEKTCGSCNSQFRVASAKDASAALGAVRQQLHEFSRRGTIDQQTFTRLAAAIEEESQRLENERAAVAVAQVALEPLPSASSDGVLALSATVVAAPQNVVQPAQPKSPPIRERARNYAVSREVAAAEVSLDAGELVEVPPKREALSRLFAAFMEEKNIRWGELIGGLLIVGCSIALVISFWSQIAARPFLKFGLFNGVTAGLFGIGIYTERRWKIHTTSRGVLIIATLLVPLNFLAIAAFTQASPPTDLLSLGGEALSLGVFAFLVYVAGRILVNVDAVLFALGVMIACLMQLLVRRFAGPATPLSTLYLLAVPTVAAYIVTVGLATRRRWKLAGPFTEVEAHGSFILVGLISASALMPLALLLHNVPPASATLHWLSPNVTLLGLPAMFVGLLFWHRLSHKAFGGLQTAGIAIGVLGAFIMAAAVVLAWPDPATMLPTSLLLAAVLISVAVAFDIPVAYLPAGLAIAAAWLIGFHLVVGNVGWTLADSNPIKNALLRASSGNALVPIVAALGVLTLWLKRLGRSESGRMVGLSAVVTAVVSLALVLWFGFGRLGDPAGATWTMAIYAVATAALAIVIGNAHVVRLGSALALLTLGQAIVYRFNPTWQLEQPWIAALLSHATLVALGCAIFTAYRRRQAVRSLVFTAQVTSFAALTWVLATIGTTSPLAAGLYFAWLTCVWLLLSALTASAAQFTAAQVTLVAAIACGVTARVSAGEWYGSAQHPWLDPWFLEAQGIALAAYCLLYGAARRVIAGATRDNKRVVAAPSSASWVTRRADLIDPRWITVDRIVLVALVGLAAMIAIYAAAPGAAQEWSPTEVAGQRIVPPIERFELPGIPHAHSAGRGAWLLLGAVAISLGASISKYQIKMLPIVGLTLLVMATSPLLASHWESGVAVASALRWLSAATFAVLSVLIWNIKRNGETRNETLSTAPEIEPATMPAISLAPKLASLESVRPVRDLLIAFVIGVYIAMAVYIGQAQLIGQPINPQIQPIWPWVLIWALVAGVAGVFSTYAAAEHRAQSTKDQSLARAPHWIVNVRHLLWLLAFAPLATLVMFAVAKGLAQHPLVGPNPGSWFREVGNEVSYGVPILVIAVTFVGYAIRDRSDGFAFAAGLLFNIVATIVVILRVVKGGGALNESAWILITQVNAFVAGVVALVWLGANAFSESRAQRAAARSDMSQVGLTADRQPLLLITQVGLAATLCAAFLLPATIVLAYATKPTSSTPAADGALGWITVAIAIGAAYWINQRKAVSQGWIGVVATALVSLCAVTAARFDSGNLESYHTLLAGCCAAAWLVPLATTAVNRFPIRLSEQQSSVSWSSASVWLFAAAAAFLAFWEYSSGPQAPWWKIAALVAMTALSIHVAYRRTGRRYMWIAALLFLPASSILWIEWASRLRWFRNFGNVCEFFWANIIATALIAVISVWIEHRTVQRSRDELSRSSTRRRLISVPFYRFAAWAIVVVLTLTTVVGLLTDLYEASFAVSWALAWAAWCAALIVAVAALWDPEVEWSVGCMYVVGLIAVGMYLDSMDLHAPLFHWALANALAAYSLATSAIWSVRDRVVRAAFQLGLPLSLEQSSDHSAQGETRGDALIQARVAPTSRSHYWLVSANLTIGLGVLLLVAWIELSMDDFSKRMVAAYAVGAQAFAIGLLAYGAVRLRLQYLALAWGVLFAVAFSWSWLPPEFPAPWLHRLVVTVAAIAAMIVVYGLGLVKFLKRENEWTRAAERFVPILTALAGVLILLVLGMEIASYVQFHHVPISYPALAAVALALAGLAAAALAAALVPGRDPLGLSERGRTLYVYAAEAMAALLFLHIRVTMDWLFRGWFMRFWPIIVMLIAFTGVGLAEVFHRRKRTVLSEPLETTGAILPLLPALGFWIVSSEVHYSLLLLSIGVLYAGLSVLRSSFIYAMLAAVAANGSLWYLLSRQEGLDITQHPQIWLIPPALCALVAGYINRDRLTPQQAVGLRSASAIVIYISSTADVFINGVAEAPWLPAVLAALSIIGCLAGILLRVRAFLYLGATFLVVALMTVIWHAAEERTWIWWVTGIITGSLIIAMFGLFEKRRDDVLRLVEDLKHWNL